MDDSGVLDVLDENVGDADPGPGIEPDSGPGTGPDSGPGTGPDSGPVLDLDKSEPGLGGENVGFWTVFWGPSWEKVFDWGIGRFWDKLDVLDKMDELDKLDENWVTG